MVMVTETLLRFVTGPAAVFM